MVVRLCRGGGALLQHHVARARRALHGHLTRHGHVHDPLAPRSDGGHHAVQLPGDDPALDVPGGGGVRQHVRGEAERARPGRHDDALRARQRGRLP